VQGDNIAADEEMELAAVASKFTSWVDLPHPSELNLANL
jgi:hypothetical protein